MGNEDLESVPLFAGLTSDERGRVGEVVRRLKWRAGDVAVHEGEFAFDFYAITSGAAEVRRSDQRIAVLASGDFFGELGVVPSDPSHWSRRRTASVVITEPTDAVAIAGSDLRMLADAIPALHDALREAAAARDGHGSREGA